MPVPGLRGYVTLSDPELTYYLITGDVSTQAADFQAPANTAAPGTTGRVADAGHVHPAPIPWVSVKAYGAAGNGTTDDTAAIQAAINAITGNANPATTGRTATGVLYFPSGTYKVTSDLLIQSVLGFVLRGDGEENTTILASGAGFTNAVLQIDGSYHGEFGGFTMRGDGTEGAGASPVPYGINLTWTTAAQRSTTANIFHSISIRNLNFATGIANAAPAGTTRQVDGTTLRDVVVGGGGTATFGFTTAWLVGFQFGNGTAGNQYDYEAYNCYFSGCQAGVLAQDTGFGWWGGQPALNAIDFQLVSPNAQVTIQNVQSQNSGRFLQVTGGSSAIRTSIRDILFTSTVTPTSSRWISITASAATWVFENVASTASAYTPVVYINGQGNTEVAAFISFSQTNTLAAGIIGPGSTPSLVAVNYTQLNANGTVNTATPIALNTTGAWSALALVSNTDIQWFTTPGANTWNKPSGGLSTEVILLGAGGGGGSGAMTAGGTLAGGGGGGGGGGVSMSSFSTADMASTVAVSVGASGVGGTAVTAAASGVPGGAGGSTLFGTFLWAHGGSGGGAGTSTIGGAAGLAGAGLNVSSAGGAGSNGSAAGANSANGASTGGGGGGGVNAGGTAQAGGATSAALYGSSANTGSGGVVSGASPGAGAQPTAKGVASCGGGGGAGADSGTAQQGATAFYGGGGGGGGGASGSATSSGAGGNGGNGWALVITHFA